MEEEASLYMYKSSSQKDYNIISQMISSCLEVNYLLKETYVPYVFIEKNII